MKKGKVKSIVLLVIIAVLVALLTFITFASFKVAGYKNGTYDFVSIINKVADGDGLSQEFNDGVYYKLTPKEATVYEDEEISVEDVLKTIKKRLAYLGYDNAIVYNYGDGSIGVILENATEAANDMATVSAYGNVQFRDSDGNVILESEHIQKAYATERDQQIYVVVELTSRGTKLLAAAVDGTKKIGIYLGETTLLSPSAEIPTDGTIYISGNSTMEQAKRQALQISSGGLAVEFDVSNGASISPSAGKIQPTVIALVVALALILVLMVVFYRGFAIATDISVLTHILLTLFFIAVIPGITISAGGLVGLIAGVLVCLEGNITVLHGIKREFAEGKTLRAAVKQSFKKATMQMVDVTVFTGVAALLMYFICSGFLKSFAITFGISVIVAALVNQLLLRLLVKLSVPLAKDESKFFNLKKEEAEANA